MKPKYPSKDCRSRGAVEMDYINVHYIMLVALETEGNRGFIHA